jgi:para-nitrobenzyl esterase
VTIVETTHGRVEGIQQGGVTAFLGIPYAAAPVGDLRLRGPRPHAAWTGVRAAQGFGPWSLQNPPASTLGGEAPGQQDEDCLALNVWTPGIDTGRRPVMVWIHGGGFTGGSAASALYGGAPLSARGDLLVVSINYRLGLLGFAAHPGLVDEVAGGAAANWGLLDQVAALAWVRENIAAFGGDPDQVTVFGESAGAMSVCNLLGMPSTRGLFRRAVAQSGPPNAMSMERAEEITGKLLADLGVGDAARLREVPAPALLDAQARMVAQRGAGTLPLMPVVDGASLPVPPLDAIASGNAADIELVIGTNRDEAKMFMVADPKNRDPDEAVLHRRIERAFAVNDVKLGPDEAIKAYRSARAGRGQTTDPRELWSAIETDRMFRIGSLRAAEAQARHQARTYCYLFDWESPAMGGALGACHALEIPFVFGNLAVPTMDRFAGSGPAAEQLSEQMMDAWIGFARRGDPSPPGAGAWPAYDDNARATMIFGPKTHVEHAPYEEERRTWERAAGR